MSSNPVRGMTTRGGAHGRRSGGARSTSRPSRIVACSGAGMRTTLLLLGALPVVLAQAGCRNDSLAQANVAPGDPVAVTSARPSDPATFKARMRDHDLHGAAMRNAVARADLEAARREATTLAELRLAGGIEPPWRRQLDAMNAAAARVAAAKDVPEMSRNVAAVARTCGDCHATLGGPVLPVGEPPEPGSGVAARMMRHQWAAARLWDGLVAPSQEAWRAGARVLADAPLEPETLTPGKSPAPAIGTLARSVHDLGQKAKVVTSGVDRAAVYGELLATCSACHLRLGGGPP